MNDQIKKTLLSALSTYQGDDLERARAAFRRYTPEQMKAQHGQSGRTRAEILAEYEQHAAKVEAAREWWSAMSADAVMGEALPEGCEHGMRWDRQCSACARVMASDPLAEPWQEYRYNVEFRDGSRLGGLTWVEVQRHDGHLAQVWRVPVWPAGVTKVAPTYRQIGWTIDTASGRLFETNITAEQRTRWQPVYITDGVQGTLNEQGKNHG